MTSLLLGSDCFSCSEAINKIPGKISPSSRLPLCAQRREPPRTGIIRAMNQPSSWKHDLSQMRTKPFAMVTGPWFIPLFGSSRKG
ncbi:hypothetical protein GDO81_028064 [Engystomops pustulosus]|uniref:Uncharacterized protein n=1 Tax=Engystomops pustulosus TaxID=76066 RepID=A0AAV6ZEA5_ENGPU|nr:hypothetical protein GDO81_028064 [Engystomops pustulosus]